MLDRPCGGSCRSAPEPLKILLINYRYFVSGGPERYLFNLTGLLESEGHRVVPFSIAYDRNEETPFAPYFAPPIGSGTEVYFRDHKRTIHTVAREAGRAFYSREVYDRLKALIEDERPDVAIVLHYLRKLSPSVLTCLHDHAVPFAVRVSDFGTICPNAHLYRAGHICELCTSGALRHSVKHRCVQGSLAASAVNYAATRFHRVAGYYNLIQTFLVPSRFTVERMVAAGYARERLVHIPTFVKSPDGASPSERTREPMIAYVGRLDELKGAGLFLEAVRILGKRVDVPVHSVQIVGTGEGDYVDSLQGFVAQHGLSNVTFVGNLLETGVRSVLREATCSATPSLWFDNLPNAALESMSEGTPVVAPDHGCFPELVRDGETGALFRPGDAHSLADRLMEMLRDPRCASAMGKHARAVVSEQYSPGRHYELLMQTIDNVRSRRIAA